MCPSRDTADVPDQQSDGAADALSAAEASAATTPTDAWSMSWQALSPQIHRSGPARWLAIGLIGCVRCYQIGLSPLLGRICRFHPSCSRYFVIAVCRYGVLRGSWKGLRRVARCHPWNPGGYDPP